MSETGFQTHPEIDALLEPPTPEELETLRSLIVSAKGCRDPLVVWKEKNILLDGHSRLKICRKEGYGYVVKSISFPDMDAAKIWVLENQCGRRNLNDYQRTAAAIKLVELKHKGANLPPGKPLENQAKTRDLVGDLADVSPRTADAVKAIEDGAAAPIKKMASDGDVSIDAAAKVATLPKKRQRKIAAKGPDAVVAAAAKVREDAKKKRKMRSPKNVSGEVKDSLGHVIEVKGVAEVFSRRDEITGAMSAVSKLKTAVLAAVKSRDALYAILNDNAFEIDCDNVHRHLRFALPHSRCPLCNGDGGLGGKCKLCKGRGWIGEQVFRNLPAEQKK